MYFNPITKEQLKETEINPEKTKNMSEDITKAWAEFTKDAEKAK